MRSTVLFERPAPGGAAMPKPWRALLRLALAALARLVLRGRPGEPPAEWYKYPPF